MEQISILDQKLYLNNGLHIKKYLGKTKNIKNDNRLEAGSGTHYIPRWSEVAVTLSIVAAGFAIFRVVAQYFPVFEAHSHELAASEIEAKEEDRVPVA